MGWPSAVSDRNLMTRQGITQHLWMVWTEMLPFLTTKSTFSPRKTVTFYLADKSAPNRSSFPSHLPRRRSWIFNGSCFCGAHISAPDTAKNPRRRGTENCQVKKTLRYEGTALWRAEMWFPRVTHTAVPALG